MVLEARSTASLGSVDVGNVFIFACRFICGWIGLTIRVRVGRKGYIVIPKRVRELVGVKEGEELILDVKEGKIVLEPAKPVKLDELDTKMREHLERISYVKRRPALGELENISLEEEFDDVP